MLQTASIILILVGIALGLAEVVFYFETRRAKRMAEVERHEEQVVVNRSSVPTENALIPKEETNQSTPQTTHRLEKYNAPYFLTSKSTLKKFGSTFIDLSQIIVIEFDLDNSDEESDSEFVNGDAKVQLQGCDEEWTIPEEDAILLYRYMMTNITT